MLHLTLDLNALGEREEEVTRAAAADMDSRAVTATATAAASGTETGSRSEELTHLGIVVCRGGEEKVRGGGDGKGDESKELIK